MKTKFHTCVLPDNPFSITFEANYNEEFDIIEFNK